MSVDNGNGQNYAEQQEFFWDNSIITLLRLCNFTEKEFINLKEIVVFTSSRHGDAWASKALENFMERGDFSSFSGDNARRYVESNIPKAKATRFFTELTGHAIDIMSRRSMRYNSCLDPNIKNNAEEKFFSEKIISFLKGHRFTNSTKYEMFRKSLLDTYQEKATRYGQEYGAVLAINALKSYVVEGNFSQISGPENIKYIGLNTQREDAANFLNIVTRKSIELIKEEEKRLTKPQISKPKAIRPDNVAPARLHGNIPQMQHNGIYVVSDLHGDINQFNKVKEHVGKGQKVIVLGDAVDRGNDGIEIIQKIMQLQKLTQQNGNSLLEYLPGNHDLFLYETLFEGMRRNDARLIVDACDRRLNNPIDQRNGLTPTYSKLKYLAQTRPSEVFEIGRWLGRQPLLRLEIDNGKKIALGHAAFDVDLYKAGYTLERYMNDKINSQNKTLRTKAFTCLWYRNINSPDEFDKEVMQDALNFLNLPTTAQADEIVVGHTPKKYRNNDYTILTGINGTSRQAICVDMANHGRVSRTMGAYNSRKSLYPYNTVLEGEGLQDISRFQNSPSNWPTNARQGTVSAARNYMNERNKANANYQIQSNSRQINRDDKGHSSRY